MPIIKYAIIALKIKNCGATGASQFDTADAKIVSKQLYDTEDDAVYAIAKIANEEAYKLTNPKTGLFKPKDGYRLRITGTLSNGYPGIEVLTRSGDTLMEISYIVNSIKLEEKMATAKPGLLNKGVDA